MLNLFQLSSKTQPSGRLKSKLHLMDAQSLLDIQSISDSIGSKVSSVTRTQTLEALQSRAPRRAGLQASFVASLYLHNDN